MGSQVELSIRKIKYFVSIEDSMLLSFYRFWYRKLMSVRLVNHLKLSEEWFKVCKKMLVGLRTPLAIAETSIPEIVKALFESLSWAIEGSAQRSLQLGVAKKIKNGARKIVFDKAEEARISTFSAFKSLGYDVPQLAPPIPTPARNSIRKEVGSSSGSDTADTSHSFDDKNHFDNSKIVALEKEKDLNKSSDNDARASVEEKLRQRDAIYINKMISLVYLMDAMLMVQERKIIKENLVIITSKRTKGDELVIIHLGDGLWKEKRELSLQRLYMLSLKDSLQEEARQVANESPGNQQGAVGESNVQINYSNSDQGGLIELEKLLKQKTFTRSEIDHLTTLMQSRTVDAPIRGGRRLKVCNEITSAETTDTNTGIPSQCCEISNEDQNHIAPVSKPASGGEKQIDTSSSCNDQSHRSMQEDMKLDLKLEEGTKGTG
ncbi:hypothetical protein KIW84_032118 [Lathyrus oleraceus]|uniref:Uncharacterized protein n=1 Tax=Pisum sativum TaxID=3888 RepID=A0A9D4XTI0_PEA|nr:hypothetical protein KIW84_032118 [Pisum sativum]